MFTSSSSISTSIPQYGICLIVLLLLIQNIIAAPPSLLSRNDVSSLSTPPEDFMKSLEYQSINNSCIYPPQDIFISQPNIMYNLLSEYCSLPKDTEKLSHLHEKYSFLCNELKTITNKLCELGGKVTTPIELAATIIPAKYEAFIKNPKEFCTTFQKNHKDFRLNNMQLPGVIEDKNKQSFDEFFDVSAINVNEDIKNEHHHHQCENICQYEMKSSTPTPTQQIMINPLCAFVFKGYEIYNTLSDDLTQVAEEKGKGQPENADLNSSGEVQDNVIMKDENPLQSIMPIKSKKNSLHTDNIPNNDEKITQQHSSAFNIIQNSSTISQTSGTNTSINNSNNIINNPSKVKNEEGENIGDNKNVNQNPTNQQDSKIPSSLSSTAKTIIVPSKEPNDIVNPDEYIPPENELDDAGGDITIPLDNPSPAVIDKKESHPDPDRKQPDQPDKKTTFDQQHVSASSGDKYYMIVKNPKDRTTIEFAINPESEINFSSYFLIMIGLLLFGYFTFHHKKRIIAYVIEGKRPQREVRTRRASSTSYRKLENNYD